MSSDGSGTYGEAVRFILLGGTNTGLTTAAFYLLSYVTPPWVAFTVVYLAGMTLVIVVLPRFVFRSQPSVGRRVALALWYLCVYGVGLVVVRTLTQFAGSNKLATAVCTAAVTAPLTFFGARLIAKRQSAHVDPKTGAVSSTGGSTPSA